MLPGVYTRHTIPAFWIHFGTDLKKSLVNWTDQGLIEI